MRACSRLKLIIINNRRDESYSLYSHRHIMRTIWKYTILRAYRYIAFA